MPSIETSAPAGGETRYQTIDVLRGFAVMGILLMNIVAYSMPEAAYINPAAWGAESIADYIVWTISFLLVDGKMRGLFSLLFGASMLILIDRTEMTGGDGRKRHITRSFWLVLIGLGHYALLWWGDILTLYAFVGLIALFFVGKQPMELVKYAFIAFGLQFIILTLLMVSIYYIAWQAAGADASADQIADATNIVQSIGAPGSPFIADQIALYRGDWNNMITEKLADYITWVSGGLYYMGLEILGFMLLGMAMLKGGFLTGAWQREQYIAVARHGFLIGLLPMAGLALWVWLSGFDTVTTFGAVFTWSLPFRVPLTVAITALFLALIKSITPGPMLRRVEAVGRTALTNYVGTSLLMTSLFYGWGDGQFGHMSRIQVYTVVPMVWAIMLFWSRPWLDKFRYGPLEWIWRSLTLLSPQPILQKSKP